ncbi:MAG TPA: dihydroorotase [Fimbriimonas sp.]|nr:dihydroorotase [Fimbriimonas sp.]
MTCDTLIRNGRLVTSTHAEEADLAIAGGKIVEIGSLGEWSARETIDARGLFVLPGLIDTQVHFREPGLEHKEDIESGTRAALHGGVTSILEMPNTKPTTTSRETLEDKLNRARGRAWCHYGFFVGATTDNADELGDLEKLPGTPGIKIFMGSSTGSLLVGDDEHLEKVLRNGMRRCPIHAEDEPRNRERKSLISSRPTPLEHPFLRDAESARLATQRILGLSAKTGRPVHILHLSTRDELPLIADAKRKGLGTTAEVTPQHLWFSAPECYERWGSLTQMNPPIRSSEHREGLWKALGEGLFDVFGSDHAPHTLVEKSLPYPQSPSGMPGVQTLLPVLMTFAAQDRISVHDVVRMGCERPAELYGIQGKGRLERGFDADLVLVDPKRSKVFERRMVQSKCGWSPFEGETLTGWSEVVILGGEVVVRSDERLGSPRGRQLDFQQAV